MTIEQRRKGIFSWWFTPIPNAELFHEFLLNPSPLVPDRTGDILTLHRIFAYYSAMGGTTGLEPATSAVTVTLTGCI